MEQMATEKRQMRCPACGQESWLVRTPRYEGFRRVGETLSCAMCGQEFGSEAEVELRAGGGRPQVFTEADRPSPVRLFEAGETDRMCRHCAEYVVNPFLQRCMLHQREVEATDTCPQFRARAEERGDG